MRLNGFSITVCTAGTGWFSGGGIRELNEDDEGYVALPHESEYSLKLENHRNTRCDIMVYVDGESIGCWRINEFSSIVIERPGHSARKLVFVKEDTTEAKMGDVKSGNKDNGLIKVIFKPEIHSEVLYKKLIENTNMLAQQSETFSKGIREKSRCYSKSSGGNRVDCAAPDCTAPECAPNYQSGATVLGDKSLQTFQSTQCITNYDHENQTTINLRLVASSGIPKYVPLKQQLSNVEPPRVRSKK